MQRADRCERAPRSGWDVVFSVIAAAFIAASAFHAWRAIDPVAGDATSPGRHAFWVFADIATAAAVFFRPPYIVVAFALFLCQQLWAHGTSAIEAASRGEFSGGDWLIVVCQPAFFVLICIDARRRARLREAKDAAA